MSEKRHKLVERQLKILLPMMSYLTQSDLDILNHFISEVSAAYIGFDDDRELLERSSALSSTELYNVNKDIREQNIKLQEVQKVAEKLRYEKELILNSVGEGIYRIDLDGKTTFINPAALQMTGWEASEIIGKYQHLIFHHTRADGTNYPSKDCPIYAAVQDGSVHRVDTEVFWRKDGTSFPVDYTSTPIYENGKIVGAVVVFKDISKRKQIENELRDAAHQAGMAEIATGILHNVGNILNSVNVGMETMQRVISHSERGNLIKANNLLKQHQDNIGEFFLNDPKGKILPKYYIQVGEAIYSEYELLHSEVNELQKRIQLIKDVINSQQAHAKCGEFKEEVFITEVIESAIAMQINSLTKHDIKVEKKLSDTGVTIAQKTKLIHVLLNLIKNAKEAMISNGIDPKILTIESADEGQNISIKLTDTGEGIKKENQEKIFNHGYTTKASGHGFGLHFCANSITEMGGKIFVKSDGLGKGTTFTILLPKKEISKVA